MKTPVKKDFLTFKDPYFLYLERFFWVSSKKGLKNPLREWKSEEDIIQACVVKWVEKHMPQVQFSSIPNGQNKSKFMARLFKLTGLRSGAPDLFFFEPRNGSHGFGLELKTKTGTIQSTQKEWREKLLERGYHHEFAKGLTPAIEAIKKYFRYEG